MGSFILVKIKFKYESFKPMKKKEYEWFLNYALKLPKKSKILDAGCGTAGLVDHLRAKGYEAWGVDIHTEKKKGYKKEDMRHLSFPNEYFDLVMCINTLENIGIGAYGDKIEYDGDRKALLEFKRVLKKDGEIVIAVAFGEACLKKRKHPFRVYDVKGLKWLIKGFRIKKSLYFYFDTLSSTWKETRYPEQVINVFKKSVVDWMGNVFLILGK